MFQAEISSFALRLAVGGKAAKTIRSYTEAVQWFAAAHLTDHHSRAAWEQVRSRDIQWWMAWLLDRYSTAACGYLQAERRLGHVVIILEHVHSRSSA
jgi:hypothetical protein